MHQRTLRYFILRTEVLHLYRHAIRASRGLGHPDAQKETVAWIRGEIERNKNISDPTHMEDKLRQMRRELKQLFPGARF